MFRSWWRLRAVISITYCVPLWGTHKIIKVPERGGSILLKYTKSLFKFVNFQMFIILSKSLAWFCIYVYITYSFKARCSIEFEGAVNKRYYSVRQISMIQYMLILTVIWVVVYITLFTRVLLKTGMVTVRKINMIGVE